VLVGRKSTLSEELIDVKIAIHIDVITIEVSIATTAMALSSGWLLGYCCQLSWLIS